MTLSTGLGPKFTMPSTKCYYQLTDGPAPAFKGSGLTISSRSCRRQSVWGSSASPEGALGAQGAIKKTEARMVKVDLLTLSAPPHRLK